MLLYVSIAGAVVLWFMCTALILGLWGHSDDLPYNRPVRGLMLLFSPLVCLGWWMYFIVGGVLRMAFKAAISKH